MGGRLGFFSYSAKSERNPAMFLPFRARSGPGSRRTCLLSSTPTARGVTFHTMPVRPWYARYGIPFCCAGFTLMSTY